MLSTELSIAERRMFVDLGFGYLMDAPIGVIGMYNIAVEKVFADNQTGGAVEALRRGIKHMRAGGFRGNKKFDEMIGY